MSQENLERAYQIAESTFEISWELKGTKPSNEFEARMLKSAESIARTQAETFGQMVIDEVSSQSEQGDA